MLQCLSSFSYLLDESVFYIPLVPQFVPFVYPIAFFLMNLVFFYMLPEPRTLTCNVPFLYHKHHHDYCSQLWKLLSPITHFKLTIIAFASRLYVIIVMENRLIFTPLFLFLFLFACNKCVSITGLCLRWQCLVLYYHPKITQCYIYSSNWISTFI